jgi:hypothetical protein
MSSSFSQRGGWRVVGQSTLMLLMGILGMTCRTETSGGECDAQMVTKRGQEAEDFVSLVTRTKADLMLLVVRP